MGELARHAARTPPSEEGSPFRYVDESLKILGRTFDSYDQRMRQEFLGQREFIAATVKEVEKMIDTRFKELERRFQEVEKMIDTRFKELERRFQEIEKKTDRKLQEVDTKMRERLVHMQRASRNFLCTRGWEEIQAVGTFDARGGIHTPDDFPRTVKRFWQLKNPTQLHRLVGLIRFYNVQGHEEWGMDTDSLEEDSDSDNSGGHSSNSSKVPIPMEVAVQAHPEFAHRALAGQLGLNYDGISGFMERAQDLSKRRAEGLPKRKQDEDASQQRKRRGAQSSHEDGTEVTSPTEPLASQ